MTEPMAQGPQLICGNRNYSSWSLRAWLCLQRVGLDADVTVLPMDTQEFDDRIAELSPTRRVPVLRLGDLWLWDSLAIAETVSERFAGGRLWPADADLRALGRSAASEMHSGFPALRDALPMNCRAEKRRVDISAAVRGDIERIETLWSELRSRSGSDGWLLGDWSIADAMYAPVVLRFRAYAVELASSTREYCDRWLSDPDLRAWIDLAQRESWTIEHEEVGEP
ncbi:MAG: glutathione S-transferase [Pseudomonadota bacterium]